MFSLIPKPALTSKPACNTILHTWEYLALERTVTTAGEGGGLPGCGGGASQRALESRIRSPITHHPGGTDRNMCLGGEEEEERQGRCNGSRI